VWSLSRRLGMITIGQAPREDLEDQVAPYLPPDVELYQVGALDDVSPRELAALAPRAGEDVYVTRLRDGPSVVLARRRLIPLVRAAVRRVEEAGVAPAVLMCTGRFPPLTERSVLLEPDRVVGRLVDALRPRRLGVLVPLPEQVGQLDGKWRRRGRALNVQAASPYDPGSGALDDAARALAAWEPDLVVMDCMGYTDAHRRRVRRHVGCPVVLSVSAVAAVAAQLLAN